MAPCDVNVIGVLDTSTHAISTFNLTGEATTGYQYNKYHGAVAVGDVVYFVPHDQQHVGALNTALGVFSTIRVTGPAAATGWGRFAGAAVSGTKIYFVSE